MHVLTKIFIVLVTLLAVLLVPLVVVYAYNENSYQASYQQSEDKALAALQDLKTAQSTFGAIEANKDSQIQELSDANRELQRKCDQQEADVNRLESRLAQAESNNAEIDTKLTTLAAAVDAGQRLTQSLIDELRSLRRDALAAERQKVELDEALRDALAKLDVAVEARRALQEQLQRLRDEQALALERIAQYVAMYGEVEVDVAGSGGLTPDENLDATIISVRRSSDQVFAEIDAGSRDGVKEGWVMTIGHGGNFIAKLRIVNVDINRSTGIIELEQTPVQIGYIAYARTRR